MRPKAVKLTYQTSNYETKVETVLLVRRSWYVRLLRWLLRKDRIRMIDRIEVR